MNPESPFCYKRGVDDYYLWSQLDVRHSNDPLDYSAAIPYEMGSGKYAPEVIHNNGEFFIAGYSYSIHMAQFYWKSSKDHNVYLKSLDITEGTFTPTFDSLVDHYTMTVDNGITDLTITGITASPQARISYEGNENLQVGLNKVKVIIDAENTLDRRVYTVDVYRLGTEESKYQLTVNGGSGTGEYPAGAEVVVKANQPEPGELFGEWTGDVAHIKYMEDYINFKNITVVMPAEDITLNGTTKPGYTVILETRNAITKAVLSIWTSFYGPRQKTRSADGRTTVYNVEEGIHHLSVYSSGFHSFAKNILIDKDTTILVEMLPSSEPEPAYSGPSYTITFEVTDGEKPLNGIKVKFSGKTYFTDNLGKAEFTDIPEGWNTYKIFNTTYEDFWGSVETDSDKTVSVILQKRNQAEPEYLVTVNDGTGTGYYAQYRPVNISANPAPEGKIFDQWFGNTELLSDFTSSSTSFLMPDWAVELTATYKEIISSVKENKYQLKVIPNPASDQLTVRAQKSISTIILHDISGRKYLEKSIHENNAILDVSKLPAGIYFVVTVFRDNTQQVSKVILE